MSIYDSYCATGHAKDATPESLQANHEWYAMQFGPVLPKDRDIRVIDLGCGPGYFLSWLAASGYHNAVGVDESRVLLDMAADRGISTVHDDIIHYLEVNSEQADVISLFHVLEHFSLEESQYLLKLVSRRLKAGGLFLVAVPNVMAPFPVSAYGDISHRLYFSWQSLRQLLVSAEFSNVRYLPLRSLVERRLRGRVHHVLRAVYLNAYRLLDGLVNGFAEIDQRPLDMHLLAACGQRDFASSHDDEVGVTVSRHQDAKPVRG